MALRRLTMPEKASLKKKLRRDDELRERFLRSLEQYKQRHREDFALYQACLEYGLLPKRLVQQNERKAKRRGGSSKSIPKTVKPPAPGKIVGPDAIPPSPSANRTRSEPSSPPEAFIYGDETGDKGATVTMREKVEWVFEHLEPDVEMVIRPEDAPCRGAWIMLCVYRQSDEFRRRFYETFLPKFLPKQSEIDLEAERYDRGEVPLTFLKTCQAAQDKIHQEHVENAAVDQKA